MHYIVFDLEWNIAGRANKVDPEVKAKLPFEIMEIGAVKLDESFNYISQFSIFVKPKYYTILSGYIAAVTRRLQQSLNYGMPFPDAARSFRDFCGEDYVFCTWSDSDISTLQMNLEFYGLASLMPALSLDVQYLFDALIEHAGTQRNIEYAIDFLRVSKRQPFHQAVNDARYTGLILAEIVNLTKSDSEGLTGAEIIAPFLIDPSLNRTRIIHFSELENMQAALDAANAVPAECPACYCPLTQHLPWQLRRRNAEAVFLCPEHGRVSARLRLKPRPDKLFNAQLTFRLLRHLELLRSEQAALESEQTTADNELSEAETDLDSNSCG
ncbi:MAG: exonuclease domain-containing protein [Ruminococcaceae bacterium]|nr:exonuclease domain-containing protein [Oscillospiraceae bacterium]